MRARMGIVLRAVSPSHRVDSVPCLGSSTDGEFSDDATPPRPRFDSLPIVSLECHQQRSQGALRSPPDPEDVVFEKLIRSMSGRYLKELPSEFDLTHLTLPVRDQLDRNTCAAFVGSVIKESHAKKHDETHTEHFSPEFIYYNRQHMIPGMYSRDVFRVMKTQGVPLESEYPYLPADSVDAPPKRVYRSASQHTIQDYALVTSVEGLKRSLVELGICMMTLPMYNQTARFWRPIGDAPESTSGHAVAVCGYSDSKGGFIVRNSWGPHWNGNGYFMFPYEDWPYVWECWTCFATPIVKKDKSCAVM